MTEIFKDYNDIDNLYQDYRCDSPVDEDITGAGS